MKKFLKEFAIFFLILILIAIIINYCFGHRYYNHYELQYKEIVEQKKKIDCIILGTSHGTHGIRPEVLDSLRIGFYNFAMNGSSPEFYWNWYTNVFAPNHPAPKYCLWATDWFLFDTTWLWRQYEQDSEYFPDSLFYANLKSSEYNTRSLIFNRVPFTKYKSYKDLPNLFRPYDESQFIISEYKDGFLPYWPEKVEKFKDRFNNKLKDTYLVSPRQKGFFEKLVQRMKSDGIQPIFVNIPEYGSSKQEYEKIATFDYLDSFARKNGIPFLNYNLGKRTILSDDKKYFADWGHLDSKGSYEFSRILMNDLKSIVKSSDTSGLANNKK